MVRYGEVPDAFNTLLFRSECQNRDHIISVSPDHGNEVMSAFDTMNSNDTFALSHSTNTTFTSFYGSHEMINAHMTTTT